MGRQTGIFFAFGLALIVTFVISMSPVSAKEQKKATQGMTYEKAMQICQHHGYHDRQMVFCANRML